MCWEKRGILTLDDDCGGWCYWSRAFLWPWLSYILCFLRNTVKTVLSDHSKIDKTKILMTNFSLMKVKSIAECSNGSILQYFWPALSNNWAWKPILVFFLSGRLRQVLLYIKNLPYIPKYSDRQDWVLNSVDLDLTNPDQGLLCISFIRYLNRLRLLSVLRRWFSSCWFRG